MKNTLKKLSATLLLLAVSAQAVPLSQIDVGDTYFMNNIFSDNDLVVVKRIDTARAMVKVQYSTGGVDWVHSSKLLTKSKSRDADITEAVAGTVLVAGALWAIFDPEGFEDAMKGSPKKQPSYSKPRPSTRTAPVQNRPATKPAISKPTVSKGPNPIAALPTEPTVDGYWSVQGDKWINWAKRSLKNKTGRDVSIDSVRSKPLPFYSTANRKVVIAEAKSKYSSGAYYLLAVLGEPVVELLGKGGEPIHSLNSQLSLNLVSTDQVSSYLKFFTSSIAGEHGVFQIVDSQSASLTASQKASLNLRPVSVRKQTDGSWIADAHLIYENTLFEARFKITRSGNVEMISDKEIKKVTPSYVVNYEGSRRIAQRASLTR